MGVMGTIACKGHVGAYDGLVIDVTGMVIGSQSGSQGPESRQTGAKVAGSVYLHGSHHH